MALLSRLNAMYQRAKNILHAVQALLCFVAAMITIAVFTKDGPSDGRITYFFALCFISLAFLIYQTAVSTFQRSKRFANAYVHATIDVVLSILWLAALIGEAVWAKDGTQAGKGFKDGDSICQVFGYGSTDKCHLGQVTMWFGVAIFLLFILTSSLSSYAVFYYRNNGALPGDAVAKDPEPARSDDLEFTGASPRDTYEQSNTQQQEMQQQQQQQQQQQPPEDHHNGPTSPSIQNYDDEPRSAMLPPRPLYPKAPRTPLQGDFEPLDMSYYGAQPLDPDPRDEHDAGPSSFHHYNQYQQYHQQHQQHEQGPHYAASTGDYTLPAHPEPSMAELPSLQVDTGAAFGYRPGTGPGPGPVTGRGGGNLLFPAADYSR